MGLYSMSAGNTLSKRKSLRGQVFVKTLQNQALVCAWVLTRGGLHLRL